MSLLGQFREMLDGNEETPGRVGSQKDSYEAKNEEREEERSRMSPKVDRWWDTEEKDHHSNRPVPPLPSNVESSDQ